MARSRGGWDATNRHHRWRTRGWEVTAVARGRGSGPTTRLPCSPRQRVLRDAAAAAGAHRDRARLIDQAWNGRRPDLADDDVEALNLLTEAGVDRSADDDPGRRLTDDTQRYLAASRLLLGAARSRPILLAIDDAHALDDASVALIAHLTAAAVHQSEGLPVRLLTQPAIRPAWAERSPAGRLAGFAPKKVAPRCCSKVWTR